MYMFIFHGSFKSRRCKAMDLRSTPATVGGFLILALTLVLAGLAQDTPPQSSPSGYHLLKTISVGGTEGWDYVTMDSDVRRLYIGRDDHIDVIDVDAGTVLGK